MKKKLILNFLIVLFLSNISFAQSIKILENPKDIKITELTNLNSDSRETNLSISPDGKYLFYMSDRGGMPWSSKSWGTYKGKPRYDGDIWFSIFENGKWQNPKCLDKNVNTYSGEDEPNISPGGQFVTYQSWNTSWELKGGPYYTAVLEKNNWSQPKGMGGGIGEFFRQEFNLHSGYATDGMTLSPDRNTFIVACGANYDGNLDLYYSKNIKDKWSYCQKLSISTNKDDRSVFMAGDGRTIFFASNGYGGKGGLDIFKTTLNKDGTFGEILNIGEPFNTDKDDYGFILTASGLDAYFVRDGDIFYADLRNASQQIKPQAVVLINGKITDCKNNPVEAYIDLFDEDKNELLTESKSDISGVFSFVVPDENMKLQIVSNIKSSQNIDTSFTVLQTGNYMEMTINIKACNPGKNLNFENQTVKEASSGIKVTNATELQINFDFDKDVVKKEFYKDIDIFIESIKTKTAYSITITGHTDNKGNNEYNDKLGLRRAENVKKYLLKSGIPKDKIAVKTDGENSPVMKNDNENNRYKNRRVTIEVLEN